MLEAWRLVPGTSEPEQLTLDAATALVHDRTKDLVWIHAESPTDDEITQLAGALALDRFLTEDLREATTDPGQRTKLRQYGDLFHIAARDCSIIHEDLVEREIDLLFGEGWIGSVLHAAADAAGPDPDPFPMADVRHRVEADCANGTPLDEGLVLWAFLDVIADRYFAITTNVDERIDDAEGAFLRDDDQPGPRPDPEKLYRIGRLLTEFRRQLVPLREAASALLRHEDPAISDPALLRMRDVYDHLQGINELIESQRDVLAGLRDVQLTIVSNRMNKSMQQLAAWGAILIVATLLTGVLGMNFRDAPDLHWRDGFLLVVGIMVVVGVPMYWFFKKKEWL